MKLKKILSVLFVTAVFFILSRNIIQNWPVIKQFHWHFNRLDFILLLLFLSPIYLINGTSWFLVLKALGNKVGYRQSLKIWLLSNASRFIPGVVWQYGGRVYLSSKAGLPVSATLIALLVESVFVLAASLMIVLTTFTLWHYPMDVKFFKVAVFALAILITFLITLILLFNNQKFMDKVIPIYNSLKKTVGAKRYSGVKGFKLPPIWVAILSISYSAQFIFAGFVLFFLTRQAVNLDWNLYAVFIGIFTASWLLGYITIIAPAGLGVQEISIATMLSVYMPFPIASVIAILLRVVLLLTEAVTILIVNTVFKRRF